MMTDQRVKCRCQENVRNKDPASENLLSNKSSVQLNKKFPDQRSMSENNQMLVVYSNKIFIET